MSGRTLNIDGRIEAVEHFQAVFVKIQSRCGEVRDDDMATCHQVLHGTHGHGLVLCERHDLNGRIVGVREIKGKAVLMAGDGSLIEGPERVVVTLVLVRERNINHKPSGC